MVDARTDVVDLVLGNIHVAADQIQRGLHAVTEPDKLHIGHAAECRAVGPHRVGVVKQDRAGTQLIHVGRHVRQDGNRSQGTEDAARPDGVGDALIDAVFQWNLVVHAEGFDAADLDHVDHVVGPVQRRPAVQCRRDPGGQTVLLDDLLDEGLHLGQLGLGAVHQADFAALKGLGGQDIHHQGLAEDEASGPDHRDLRFAHDKRLPTWFRSISGVRQPSFQQVLEQVQTALARRNDVDVTVPVDIGRSGADPEAHTTAFGQGMPCPCLR